MSAKALAAILIASLTPGCSAIGAGIGAAVPTFETTTPSQLQPGAQVVAHTSQGTITGSYVGEARAGKEELDLVIAREVLEPRHWSWVTTSQHIRLRDIDRLERKTGSHWATGFGVGLVIDIALTALGIGFGVAVATAKCIAICM